MADLDADLLGASPQQLRQLIEPVRSGSCPTVRLVHWPGLTHRSKYEKRRLFRGLLAYLRMHREILRVPLHRLQPDRA